ASCRLSPLLAPEISARSSGIGQSWVQHCDRTCRRSRTERRRNRDHASTPKKGILTSDRKIEANRANARASTGPRTVRGRTRAARNALRHGLSLPVCSDPALCEEVEALAGEIAGTGANAEIQELARHAAQAQIDLRRVRHARHQFLSH